MGKALLGTHATPSSLRLLDEIRALRQRVADLEQALAAAEAVRDARTHTTVDLTHLDDREPATT
jgi:hypothetical protein